MSHFSGLVVLSVQIHPNDIRQTKHKIKVNKAKQTNTLIQCSLLAAIIKRWFGITEYMMRVKPRQETIKLVLKIT